MKVNLDGVDAWEGGSGMLEPGKHTVAIADVDEGTSSGGHPQLELRFESVDPSNAGAGIRDWIVVTPASLGRLRQFLEASGVEIPPGEFDVPTAQLFDKRLEIVVREGRKSDGTPRLEVAGYSKLESNGDVPGDKSGLPTAAAGASQQDEDIPF